MAEYRLPDQKYTEAEYLFQTIEMAKSDEEYDVELCSTPPPQNGEIVGVELQQEPSIFSWKVVKRRRGSHRRYRTSNGSPPAPPSTPTSLTASGTPTPSPTASSTATADDERLSSLLYILDYAPKYRKKLKEQQRTDAELADLFNVVTITGGGGGGGGGGSRGGSGNIGDNDTKLPPERGISVASRVIRKHDASTKIFKIHRNPKEFFREPGEEDSVSAPEYDDTEEEGTRFQRLARLKPLRRMLRTKRQRRFARFEHQERMDAMVDTFDAAMSFNDV